MKTRSAHSYSFVCRRLRLPDLVQQLQRCFRWQSPLQITVADAQPAYTAEESNRIAVYKRTLPSVVNITSYRAGVRLLLRRSASVRDRARVSS